MHRHVPWTEVRPLWGLDQPIAHFAHHTTTRDRNAQLARAVGLRGRGLEIKSEEVH